MDPDLHEAIGKARNIIHEQNTTAGVALLTSLGIPVDGKEVEDVFVGLGVDRFYSH